MTNKRKGHPEYAETALDKFLYSDFATSNFRLSGADAALLNSLLQHQNCKSHKCHPSLERIAALTPYSEDTLKRSRARLENCGLIRSWRRGRNLSNGYRFPRMAQARDLPERWKNTHLQGGEYSSSEVANTPPENRKQNKKRKSVEKVRPSIGYPRREAEHTLDYVHQTRENKLSPTDNAIKHLEAELRANDCNAEILINNAYLVEELAVQIAGNKLSQREALNQFVKKAFQRQ